MNSRRQTFEFSIDGHSRISSNRLLDSFRKRQAATLAATQRTSLSGKLDLSAKLAQDIIRKLDELNANIVAGLDARVAHAMAHTSKTPRKVTSHPHVRRPTMQKPPPYGSVIWPSSLHSDRTGNNPPSNTVHNPHFSMQLKY